jgi:tetratricopeptide (TPR) repeat protein
MPDEPKPAKPKSSNADAASSGEASGNNPNQPQRMPPSPPLQVFLLVALLLTGTAYVVDQWTTMTTEQALKPRPSKLKRLVANQIAFFSETALGHQAETNNHLDEAITHYRRALLHEANAEGRLNLGNALLKQGNPDMAFSQFKEALRLDPNYEQVYLDWGRTLALQGKLDESVQLYQDALRHNSNFAKVHYNFAKVLEQQQQTALVAQKTAEMASQAQAALRSGAEAQLYENDAVKQYAAAERAGLNTPEFWCSYGTLLNKEGKFAEAEDRLEKAVTKQPAMGVAQFQLATALDRQGKYADAVAHYEATLAAVPDDPQTLNDLALLYATATNQQARSSKMAVLLATRASDSAANQNPRFMDTLARAYAADGDFFQAVAWEDKAVRRATQLGNHDLIRELQPRLNLFVNHRSE